MPGLARKVLICAAVDGLILHPLNSSSSSSSNSRSSSHARSPASPPIRIRYGDASISPAPRESATDPSSLPCFEAYGIVGLITVFHHSFLISIVRRTQVASLLNNNSSSGSSRGSSPVYVITEVALTPCASHAEASRAVAETAAGLKARARGKEEEEEEDGSRSLGGSGVIDGEREGDEVVSVVGGGGEDETGSGRLSEEVRDEAGEVFSEPEGGGEEEDGGKGHARNGSSVAQDVIRRKGSYGRFAQRWFSGSGWAMDQTRTLGLSAGGGAAAASASNSSGGSGGSSSGSGNGSGKASGTSSSDDGAAAATAAALSLLPKLLRTSQILFGSSKTFYFAYDHDITRSMANPKLPASTPLVPLHEHVEPTYFWNRHIIQPFIDAGVDSLALPLMQGFVGQRTFVVDSQPPQHDEDGSNNNNNNSSSSSNNKNNNKNKNKNGVTKDSVELSDFATSRATSPTPTTSSMPMTPEKVTTTATPGMRPSEKKFDITIISRRSTQRAGLRYLRRGIDEDGNVANSVESEQLLTPADAAWDPNAKVYSFVQTRGSIPLFFTQSPYSLKPVPVLQHSEEANYAALARHFAGLQRRYGEVQAVNLVEKHGVEAAIGGMYERMMRRLNEDDEKEKVRFEWFDFHAVCRGMKFENVSLLLEILSDQLEAFGSSISDGHSNNNGNNNNNLLAKQKGILRTNCMDCLDRTNVCQSSFAKHMLDWQLRSEGFDMAAQADQENAWFNTLWADNGDAISKQYASTGAMKGDYTRTRKRNYRGALTDAGLSLTRLFNGMFNDFFLQASIDFLLGNVTSLVFEEFEATMMTKDPAVSMHNMRQQAIELCQKRVVADEDEDLVGGWTLLTPATPNTIRPVAGVALDEAVLLLTDAALYLCRFDWNLDKVSSFERVELGHVRSVKVGTYITSTISPAQTDEARNVGLVVAYQPGVADITRVNTRSLSSVSTPSSPVVTRTEPDRQQSQQQQPSSTSPPSSPPLSSSVSITSFLTRRPAAAAQPQQQEPQKQQQPTRLLALKALHSQTSTADPPSARRRHLSETQQVALIASEIERLALLRQPWGAGKQDEENGKGEEKEGTEKGLIEKGDIISLAEARRNTTLFEQLGHSIKKLVWA
ncbi:SAC1 family phosphatidylinositol-3-phosphatase [Dichotomopilus funicola]|uniref:SacI homology domain-containing protein n=1 Tax=Dichotomopilus funicola TaxID=1934379 RepID=A0AAN6UZZ8_9PEZI|nr:SacI homology domain-containing protein [Dichotomopilus funicola]